MSQHRGRNMTKGAEQQQAPGSGRLKNSRNLRYLNLSFGSGTNSSSSSYTSKSNGHRPHGGYKVCHVLETNLHSSRTLTNSSSPSGVPNHHPPSILSYNKPPEYLESVRNDCATKQEQEKLEHASSPQWVHGAANTRNHTGEFPLFTQQYLSSYKVEQLDASGGGLNIQRMQSPDIRSEGEYFRPNRMHQYLTATEMPHDSKKGVDIKLGRPTRTSLLRARHRSQSAPQLNSSHMDVRHLHLIGQISDNANKPKKNVLHKNLLPSTGPESLHQYLTGARYNRARWIDQHHSVSRSSSFRDTSAEDDPGYLPPYGSEASSSSSSTPGDMTPPKEKERDTLPPAVNKSSVPLTLKEINEIIDVETESKLKKDILPGRPKPAWDGAERGAAGDGLYGAPTPNSSREAIYSDVNAVLTPKRVTLQPPEDKTNSLSQHELKRHMGSEAACVICNNSHGEDNGTAGRDHTGGRGDAEGSHRAVYGSSVQYSMSITGTKVGLASPGRPKPAPRRVTFGDKLASRLNTQYYMDSRQEVQQSVQKVEEPQKEVKKEESVGGDAERTEKEGETVASEMPATVENDPVVSEVAGMQNEDDTGAAADDEGDVVAKETDDAGDENGGMDDTAEADGVAGNENLEESAGDDVVLEGAGATEEEEGDREEGLPAEEEEEEQNVPDTGRTESDMPDTQRSDLEETPRSEADVVGRISVSVVLKDKDDESNSQIIVEEPENGKADVEEEEATSRNAADGVNERNSQNNGDAVQEEMAVENTDNAE